MATISTAVSSARRCDERHGGLHTTSVILPYAAQPQTTPANVARVVFRKAFAALALIASVELLGTSTAFAAPAPALDPHGGLLATCAACHGAAGEGSSARGIPRLAGQNADYLAHALSMFKDGTRASPVMQPVAQNLSDRTGSARTRRLLCGTTPPARAGSRRAKGRPDRSGTATCQRGRRSERDSVFRLPRSGRHGQRRAIPEHRRTAGQLYGGTVA
jgi:cytochrome c553